MGLGVELGGFGVAVGTVWAIASTIAFAMASGDRSFESLASTVASMSGVGLRQG